MGHSIPDRSLKNDPSEKIKTHALTDTLILRQSSLTAFRFY